MPDFIHYIFGIIIVWILLAILIKTHEYFSRNNVGQQALLKTL